MMVHFKVHLRLGKTSLFVNLHSMKTPDTPTIGFASKVPGTCLHVQFLDYDHYNYIDLVDVLKFLQEWFEASTYYLFLTTDTKQTIKQVKQSEIGFGFHVVGLDMKTLHDTMEVVMTADCDMAFERAVRLYKYRNWVLRGFKKGLRNAPRFIGVVESPYSTFPQSLWHAEFLRINYGVDYTPFIKNPFPKTVDVMEPVIRLALYHTGTRVT